MFRRILDDRQACIGIVLIILIFSIGIFAHFIAPNDPIQVKMAKKLLNPSIEYPLGTDQLGRCILSRVIYGTRYSLGVSVIVMGTVLLASFLIGTISGYYGGVVDRVFISICDIFMAFPPMVLVLALIGLLGPGMNNLMFSMIFSLWASYTKIVRSYVLIQKNKNYVLAAKVFGTPNYKIIIRHIFPNIIPAIIVYTAIGMGQIVLMISGFSFLGLGVQPPTPEWGTMLNEAKKFFFTNPQMMAYSAIMIFITIMAFNIFGDALRDVLDPLER